MSASAFLFQTPEIPTGHKHDHLQMVLGVSGVSKIEIDGTEIKLDLMKGCVIPANTTHQFSGIGKNKSLTINFRQKIQDDLIKRIFERPRFFLLDQSMRKFVQFSAMELPEYEDLETNCNMRFNQHIAAVFTGLMESRIFKHQRPEQRIDLDSIDRFVMNRLDCKITVEEIAKSVHISPSHFFTLFREEVGKTPHQYVIEKRLEKAKLLLKTTKLTIAEISEEVGFSSQSALSNTFKKQFGCTPGIFKYQSDI